MNRRILTIALLLACVTSGVFALDCFTEIDPVFLQTDVRSTIRAVTPADVAHIRQELIELIWKAPALPGTLPEVETNVANPFPELETDPPAWRTVDELRVSMDGFVSHMYLYTPPRPKPRLMIFHQGHADTLDSTNGDGTVLFFLTRGYPVLVVNMPLWGPNTGPPGVITHDDMFALLETPEVSPFKYFIEPVVQAVNYERAIYAHRRVDMIGISGGGWTATLAAAVDPRITVSLPVAGSLPMYLRRLDTPCAAGDLGDAEQHQDSMLAIADYLDLYILGSTGSRRAQLQVLNQFDTCCFYGVRYRTYDTIVEGIVKSMRGGKFDVFLDSSHVSHLISDFALETAILPFLDRRQL